MGDMSRGRERKPKADKKRAKAAASIHLVPADVKRTPAERGLTDCPCPKDCPLHADCRFCVAYHARNKVLPWCER